jgi:hydrogenase large subunit
LDGAVVETGALARQLVAGQPLLAELVRGQSASVAARVLARVLETARVVPAMEAWLAELQPGEPYCIDLQPGGEANGVGLIEAARGALGHWLELRRGRIHNYQIVAPTTWNFSPRDSKGTPGALEQALVGLAVPDQGAIPPLVHHVVRSFDPCMVCTVH